MRRQTSGLIVVGLLIAAPVAAQHPQTREGFWISFGLGYGSARISCDACGSTHAEPGFTSYLRLGGTLNSRVLLGGDVTGWTKTSSGSTTTLGNVTAMVLFYPQAASGFHLRGGLGFSAYDETDGGQASGAGVGLTLGVGYDLRVGRNISLTGIVDLLWGSISSIESSGTTLATGWKQSLIHAGLGVTFH